MNKKTSFIAFIIILLVLAGGGAYLFMNALPTYQASAVTNPGITPDVSLLNQSATPATPPQTTMGNIVGQKFSDTAFFSNAYQIYPGTQTDSAKQALNGWSMTTQALADGTTKINLVPLPAGSADDKSQQFILQQGDTLYFVEKNPGDDQQAGVDSILADDFGVVVNTDGIVK